MASCYYCAKVETFSERVTIEFRASRPAHQPNPTISTLSPIEKNREQSKYPQKEKTQTEKAQKEVSAITHYKVLKRGKDFTLFSLELETGRTNQIRAHLNHLGYTIAGDELFRAKTNPFNRLCLHAKTLEFYHPVSGELLCFSEEPPKSWETRCK